MEMQMCRRTTTDPLLAIVSRDEYTLLRNMRTGVNPLATWVDFSGKGPFEPVGELSELLEGGLEDLAPSSADRPDIQNERTGAFEAGVGLTFLAPFFAVIGLHALTKLRTRIEGKRNAQVRIKLSGVKEWSVSLAALSQDLDARQIAASQGRLLTDGRRVAFASHVIQAQSLSVEAVKRSGRALDLGADFVFTADVDTRAKFDRESKSKMSFTGYAPVTFGVRLYELLLDAQRRALRLNRAPGYDVLDRPESAGKAAEPLLLDGSDGDLIADL
jgi:hypothetical protein